jgi:hypothetical protein
MNRYSPISIIRPVENQKPRYAMVRYPRIPLDSRDVYVYINQGDRYDTLAQAFYSDPSLWWVINRANPSQEGNSLFPTIGSQIRIPAYNRISSIITQYESLNQIP